MARTGASVPPIVWAASPSGRAGRRSAAAGAGRSHRAGGARARAGPVAVGAVRRRGGAGLERFAGGGAGDLGAGGCQPGVGGLLRVGPVSSTRSPRRRSTIASWRQRLAAASVGNDLVGRLPVAASYTWAWKLGRRCRVLAAAAGVAQGDALLGTVTGAHDAPFVVGQGPGRLRVAGPLYVQHRWNHTVLLAFSSHQRSSSRAGTSTCGRAARAGSWAGRGARSCPGSCRALRRPGRG